jgi:saccharopine dehydrogenase-like NADP-dependent oxidoreductase
MSNNILILGAGLVSKPLVRYLLDLPDFQITMASRTISKAEKIINGHPDGKAIAFDISKDDFLEELVSKSDISVSLLPYKYHVKVANFCIKHEKDLVTTSYVSPEMMDLDLKAKDAGILLLNECGLDPGIDHMSAMKIIHSVKKNGGKVTSFRSTTGALPSFEANNNPFGYKFSWSPKGVLLASRNAAEYLENGKKVSIPGEKLFENYYLQDVEDVGTFENYPNRNSTPYKDIYGLDNAKTVYRGTFRMTGWCETLRCIASLGWLNTNNLKDFSGKTYGELTRYLLDIEDKNDLKTSVANFLGLKPYSAVMKRLEWLGLLSDEPLPDDRNTPIDFLNVITLKNMSLGGNERDMIVMHHEFIAEFDSKKEYITSTLVNHGEIGGDSAIACTVSLPAAIAVKLITYDKINIKGVKIPVDPIIYEPILSELEKMDIKFVEKSKPIK